MGGALPDNEPSQHQPWDEAIPITVDHVCRLPRIGPAAPGSGSDKCDKHKQYPRAYLAVRVPPQAPESDSDQPPLPMVASSGMGSDSA